MSRSWVEVKNQDHIAGPTSYQFTLLFHVDLPIFLLLKILPFRNLYVYSIQLFPHKYYRQFLTIKFWGFFTINETVHNYLTQQTDHFYVYLAKSFQRARKLWYTGVIVKIYNYLINCLNYNCSEGEYKWNLKEPFLVNDVLHFHGT